MKENGWAKAIVIRIFVSIPCTSTGHCGRRRVASDSNVDSDTDEAMPGLVWSAETHCA